MFSHWFTFRHKYRLGYALGLALSVLSVIMLFGEDFVDWHSPGTANSGHGKLICSDCHRPAPGTTRQQLQANIKHLIGLRKHDSYFGFNPVDNAYCLDCHDRPDDRHPVQRFNEPRFTEVRKKLHPEQCVACHSEHHNVRVTQANIGFCQNCHEEFSLKHDPISVPHQTLAKQQRWDTCLGCHDFHGNHKMPLPTDLKQAIPANRIHAYFQGDVSPYPGTIRYKAKEKLDEK